LAGERTSFAHAGEKTQALFCIFDLFYLILPLLINIFGVNYILYVVDATAFGITSFNIMALSIMTLLDIERCYVEYHQGILEGEVSQYR
jgi:hypothetical protein